MLTGDTVQMRESNKRMTTKHYLNFLKIPVVGGMTYKKESVRNSGGQRLDYMSST